MPVEQQLAVSLRPMVQLVALRVLRDRRADEPRFAVADLRVRLRELGPAFAQGLDLRAGQLNPRLDSLEEVVLVPRTAVVRDEVRFGRPGHPAQCREAWPPPFTLKAPVRRDPRS